MSRHSLLRAWDRQRVAATVLLVGVLGMAACRQGTAPVPPSGAAPPPTASVLVPAGGRTIPFRVEIARTPAERERGLMFREKMAPDAGMLFIFDRPAVQSFWMQNTLISLDMLFIDGQRKIVGIVENAEPLTTTSRKVAEPSLFVLEIGGGLSARLGIRAGATVEFRDVALP